MTHEEYNAKCSLCVIKVMHQHISEQVWKFKFLSYSNHIFFLNHRRRIKLLLPYTVYLKLYHCYIWRHLFNKNSETSLGRQFPQCNWFSTLDKICISTFFSLGLQHNVHMWVHTLPPQSICVRRPRCLTPCRSHHTPPQGREVCPWGTPAQWRSH